MKVPGCPEDLTAEWLTGALRSGGALPPDGRVTAFTLEPLDRAKGMAGHLARLGLRYDQERPGAPPSVVAKFAAFDAKGRAMAKAAGIFEREALFYRHLAACSPLRTPRCHFSAAVPEQDLSVLLLEDLTAASNGDWIEGCPVEDAELAVRAMAAFHAIWWMHPDALARRWLDLAGPFSPRQVPGLFGQMWGSFLEGGGGSAFPEEIRLTGEWLVRHLAWLYPELYLEPPWTLVHNDLSVDNLFFAGGGEARSVVVADWQMATRGRGVLDLAYFLGGSLTTGHRRGHEERLLREYHGILCREGVSGYPWERCWRDYRLAVLLVAWRVIGVVGLGVVPPGREIGFREVLIPRYCTAVRDLDVGELLGDREARAPA